MAAPSPGSASAPAAVRKALRCMEIVMGDDRAAARSGASKSGQATHSPIIARVGIAAWANGSSGIARARTACVRPRGPSLLPSDLPKAATRVSLVPAAAQTTVALPVAQFQGNPGDCCGSRERGTSRFDMAKMSGVSGGIDQPRRLIRWPCSGIRKPRPGRPAGLQGSFFPGG